MPMAYAAQMGGVCTLIGTSSNLLADTLPQVLAFAGPPRATLIEQIDLLVAQGRALVDELLPRHLHVRREADAPVGGEVHLQRDAHVVVEDLVEVVPAVAVDDRADGDARGRHVLEIQAFQTNADTNGAWCN